MGLWGASDSDEAKPKNLSEANTAGTYNKKEVLAANSGWVQKAGTAASGNDNADAQPEVLVAIGGLAEALGAPISDVDGMVIGGHSDKGMVPLISKATRNSIKVSNFLSAERLDKVREDTKVGGATLTKLLGTSAWYAPGAAVSSLVQSIACNHMKIFPCSALLDGEYGLNDLCIGVPVILGRNGIEKIIELDLDSADLNHLTESAEGVSKTNSLLGL